MWAIKTYPHHICQVNRRMPGTSSFGPENKENLQKISWWVHCNMQPKASSQFPGINRGLVTAKPNLK